MTNIDYSDVRLFLAAVPPALQGISIEPLSSTSLRVQWPLLTPVTAEYGTILRYSISCSATNLHGDHQSEIAQRNITQIDMMALQPYTTYNCCASAENIAGTGVPTCGKGNTLEDGNRKILAIFVGGCQPISE